MESKIFVFLALLITATLSTGLWFDYSNSKFNRGDDYDYFNIHCRGGSGSYTWEYNSLPSGWYGRNNRIYFPRGSYNTGKYYGFKVRVNDRIYGNQLGRAIFLNIGQNDISDIFDTSYTYNVQDSNSFRSLVNRRNNVLNTGSVTTQIRTSYSFPSISEVETRIIAGDISYIRSLIDNAIGSSSNCKTVADFLSQVLTRIQGQISIIAGKTDAIERDISVLNEEIQFIQSQIENLRSQAIDIAALKTQIAQLRVELDEIRAERTQLTGQIGTSSRLIRDYESQIYSIRTNVRSAQVTIDRSARRISSIDNRIADLENEINTLRNQRDGEVQKSESARLIISEADGKIEGLNSKISDARSNIRGFEGKIVSINSEINGLQRKIADINSQISSGNFEINAEIRRLESQLLIKRGQLSESNSILVEYTQLHDTLSGAVGGFETTINEHYYSCYQYRGEVDQSFSIGSSSRINVNTDVTFGRTSNPFINYLSSVYGSLPEEDYTYYTNSGVIRPLTIYSPSWIRSYGSTFYDDSYNYRYDYRNTNVLSSDFSCRGSPSAYTTYTGRIAGINKNIFEVENSRGDVYNVHLGGCTKIDSATSYGIPRVGDNVYFKGERSGSHYNAYHVTCY